MNQTEFLQRIKKTVLMHDPHAQVILFGSRARSDYREDSDWDLLVITPVNSREKEEKIRKALFDVQLDTLQPVSTIVMGKERWEQMRVTPFYRNVNKDGQWL